MGGVSAREYIQTSAPGVSGQIDSSGRPENPSFDPYTVVHIGIQVAGS